jgi:hypothetical protein
VNRKLAGNGSFEDDFNKSVNWYRHGVVFRVKVHAKKSNHTLFDRYIRDDDISVLLQPLSPLTSIQAYEDATWNRLVRFDVKAELLRATNQVIKNCVWEPITVDQVN